jgi:putative PIN family toxin of toxin-antitoxin system
VRVALLDTNVWVSALINPTGYPAQLQIAWQRGQFEVVTSLTLLEELAEVLTRPRIAKKYNLSPQEIQEFITLLFQRAYITYPTGTVHECRDPDDDIVLETALLGSAQYVVSRDDDLKGDADLVERLRARGIQVVTVQNFLNQLKSE